MSQPDFKQEGDEFLYAFRDEAIGLRFYRLRETEGGAIRGFLDSHSIRSDRPGPIWWAQVCLTTGADRERLCKKLGGFGRDAKGWERDVDLMFQDCCQRYLALPDPVDLSTLEPRSLDVNYLIPPVLMDGQVNMLLADQGSTKSYLMLYLALCIVSGRASVFGTPSRKGPVIYFDWEVDEIAALRRLVWLCRAMGIERPKGLLYQNMGTRGRIMDRGSEMRQMIARAGAVAVFIDSLTFGAGGDLNSPEISGPTVAAIGSLGEAVTKVLAAHPSKSSRKAGPDDDVSAIGSGLFEFRARSIWLMKAPPPNERGESFVVSMRQRKISEAGTNGTLFYRVGFDRDAHKTVFSRADATEDRALSDKVLPGTERILNFLRERQGRSNTSEMARVLNMSAATVRNYCKRLSERHMVIKLGGSDEGGTAVWGLLASKNGSAQAVETAGELPW